MIKTIKGVNTRRGKPVPARSTQRGRTSERGNDEWHVTVTRHRSARFHLLSFLLTGNERVIRLWTQNTLVEVAHPRRESGSGCAPVNLQPNDNSMKSTTIALITITLLYFGAAPLLCGADD